jgi:hypothetical protein
MGGWWWGKWDCPKIQGKWDDGRVLSGVADWVSRWLGMGKVGLYYNPGKVGWWEGFEWGEELGGGVSG